MPPVMAGRSEILTSLRKVLAADTLHPLAFQVLLGPRGIGKTVVLDTIAGEARQLRWVTGYQAVHADRSTIRMLADSITEQLPRRLATKPPREGSTQRAATGGVNLGVVQLGGEAKRTTQDVPSLENCTAWLVDRAVAVTKKGGGLLLMIDEAQSVDKADLEALGGFMAELNRIATRRIEPVRIKAAVFIAGLPATRAKLAHAMSFSAERLVFNTLKHLSPPDAERAVVGPVLDAGRSIEPEALETVVARSGGYPYFIQLNSYHTWEAASDARTITDQHAIQGCTQAQESYENGVFRTRLEKLSLLQRKLVNTLAEIGDEGHIGDIARRMNRVTSDLSRPREQLIENGILSSPTRGLLTEALPGFLDFVRRENQQS